MPPSTPFARYLRAREIAGPDGILPIGLSTWWRYVATGKVPPGIRISRGVTVWPLQVVADLVAEG